MNFERYLCVVPTVNGSAQVPCDDASSLDSDEIHPLRIVEEEERPKTPAEQLVVGILKTPARQIVGILKTPANMTTPNVCEVKDLIEELKQKLTGQSRVTAALKAWIKVEDAKKNLVDLKKNIAASPKSLPFKEKNNNSIIHLSRNGILENRRNTSDLEQPPVSSSSQKDEGSRSAAPVTVATKRNLSALATVVVDHTNRNGESSTVLSHHVTNTIDDVIGKKRTFTSPLRKKGKPPMTSSSSPHRNPAGDAAKHLLKKICRPTPTAVPSAKRHKLDTSADRTLIKNEVKEKMKSIRPQLQKITADLCKTLSLTEARKSGRDHPLAANDGDYPRNFRESSPLCSREVTVYEFRNNNRESIQNLTAKISKSAQQNGVFVFPQYSLDRPRFALANRKPFKQFKPNYDDDNVSPAEMEDIDYREIAKIFEDRIQFYEMEVEQTQTNCSDETVVSCNLESVYLYQTESPFGDVPNRKRDMLEGTVRPPIRQGASALVEDIMEAISKRGKPEENPVMNYTYSIEYVERNPEIEAAERGGIESDNQNFMQN